MTDGRHKNSARVLIETSNLFVPLMLVVLLVPVVVDVGIRITVLTTKTVLLARCLEVGDRELASGVVDESVDVVGVDVLEV